MFKCNEEETFDDVTSDDDMSEILNDISDDEEITLDHMYNKPLINNKQNLTRENFIKLAENFSKLVKNSQGRSLKTIGLDVYTISEMLRLYFLTSGAQCTQKIKFWYQQRGGYTKYDESGIDFTLNESTIITRLESTNVYELEPGRLNR